MPDRGRLRRPWGRTAAAPTPDVAALSERHPDLAGAVLPPLPGVRSRTLADVMATVDLSRWEHDAAVREAPRRSPLPPPGLLTTWPAAASDDDGPLVSVVMPVHDRASSLPAAIASVQAQSHRHWELIAVDDGSTDGSVAVVEAHAEHDPRVVSVPVEHGGVSRARNAGIAAARGTYVAFLDSDNTWRPDHLRAAVAALEEHGADPLWGMAHTVLRAEKDGEVYWRALEGDREHLLVGNHVDLNVLVVRRDLLDDEHGVGGFDETLRRFVDWDLVIRLSERTGCHLVPYLGVDYHDDHEPGGAPRISTTQPWAWMAVVASRHLEAAHRHPGPADPDLVSVLLPEASPAAVLGWAKALAERPGRAPTEVVVVGGAWPRWRYAAVAAVADAVPGVRFVHLAGDRGRTVSANVALAAAAGARAVLVQGDVVPDVEAAGELAEALVDGVAIAEPHDGAPVVAVRTATVREHGGLDPLLRNVLTETDLSLRWAAAGAGLTVRADVGVRVVREPAAPPADRLAAAEALLAERYPARR